MHKFNTKYNQHLWSGIFFIANINTQAWTFLPSCRSWINTRNVLNLKKGTHFLVLNWNLAIFSMDQDVFISWVRINIFFDSDKVNLRTNLKKKSGKTKENQWKWTLFANSSFYAFTDVWFVQMISQIVCDCVCSSVLSDNDQLGLIVTALCLHLHSHSRSHDLTHKARTCHFISSSVNREKCKRQRTTVRTNGKKKYMDWMCVEFCVYVQLIPHIFFFVR